MRTATPLEQPRAVGSARVSSKVAANGSTIDALRQSGALKLLFPRNPDRVESIVVNTAGGITGGDDFRIEAKAGDRSHLTLTTQAAERIYRAQPGQTGSLSTRLSVGADATLHWVPQETILYDNAALNRSLRVDLAKTATFLMVEPVLFGRQAMGETLTSAHFADQIDVRRDGMPLYRDGAILTGKKM